MKTIPSLFNFPVESYLFPKIVNSAFISKFSSEEFLSKDSFSNGPIDSNVESALRLNI
jgi:hypothetical protein